MDRLTGRMLDTVNEGVAGLPIPVLANIGRRLLMATDTPGAYRVGQMIMELIEINRMYSRGSLEPVTISELTPCQ